MFSYLEFWSANPNKPERFHSTSVTQAPNEIKLEVTTDLAEQVKFCGHLLNLGS